MRKLLLASVALLAMTTTSNANIISFLGVNPTSAQGRFNNSPGGGAFEDQYTFELVGGPQFFTIAAVTNVFPNPTDFITNFQAAVWSTGFDGLINSVDDFAIIGPVAAQPCANVANCQFIAGSATLNRGDYYLEITGIGGGTSGYGGNIATFAVPGPFVGAGIPGLIAGAFVLLGLARRRKRTP